jgi:hypothetical protein
MQPPKRPALPFTPDNLHRRQSHLQASGAAAGAEADARLVTSQKNCHRPAHGVPSTMAMFSLASPSAAVPTRLVAQYTMKDACPYRVACWTACTPDADGAGNGNLKARGTSE